MIFTAYTPVVEGVDIIQYPYNGLINSTEDVFLFTEDGQKINTKQGISLLNSASTLTFTLENDDSIQTSTEIIKVKKDAGAGTEKTVLFLGDSLINENAYTQCVQELFQEDAMKIKLIGTRGTEQTLQQQYMDVHSLFL